MNDSVFSVNKELNNKEIEQGKYLLDSHFSGLGIALTSRCTIRCIMCSAWEKLWDIPEKTVAEIKESLPYLSRLYWQGGEVFLSEYFEALFERAKSFPELSQEIVSSGLLIDRRWVDKLVNTRLNLIYSIDGLDRTTYEHIRKGADFDVLLKNLELMKEAKNNLAASNKQITTAVNYTVMKSNYRDIRKLPAFAEKYCFDDITITPIDYIRTEENIFFHNDIKAIDFIKKAIPDISEELSEKSIRFHHWLPLQSAEFKNSDNARETESVKENNTADLACLWPWQHLFVDMGGAVKPHCVCPVVVGNIEKNSLQEIWNNKRMQEYRKNIIEGRMTGFCNKNCLANLGRRELFRIR